MIIYKRTIIILIIVVVTFITIIIGNNKIKTENDNSNKLNNSRVIVYNNQKYEIIPSDMIETGSSYASILDSLHMDYFVKKEYIQEKVGDLEDGGSIYKTRSEKGNVIIIKDYNNDYVYAFRL